MYRGTCRASSAGAVPVENRNLRSRESKDALRAAVDWDRTIYETGLSAPATETILLHSKMTDAGVNIRAILGAPLEIDRV